MNIIIKISIIALVYLILSVTLKPHRPEYTFLLRICSVILIFIFIADDISALISNIMNIFSVFNIEPLHIKLLVKVTGIAIVTDFICDNLIDQGEKTIAGVVAVSSKIIILFLAMPMLNSMIVFCLKFIE